MCSINTNHWLCNLICFLGANQVKYLNFKGLNLFLHIKKKFFWLDSHHLLIPLAGTEPINSLKIHSPAIFKLKTNWINVVLKIIRIFKTMLLVGKFRMIDKMELNDTYFTHILLAKRIFTYSIILYVCAYLVTMSTYLCPNIRNTRFQKFKYLPA